MDATQVTDLSQYTVEEIALRFCGGLFEQARAEDPRMAVCAIPRLVRPTQVEALAVVEAVPLDDQAERAIELQIYVDGRPVGRIARDAGRGGAGRMRATAGVTLLVPAHERTEVSAAITSSSNAGDARVRLMLAFH